MNAVDTNVLVYFCERGDPARQQAAQRLVENTPDAVLLWQVAGEFVAASRKLAKEGFGQADAWDMLADFQAVWPLVLPSRAVLQRAQELHLSQRIAFWDAMLYGACLEAGVTRLYSEDVPAGAVPGLEIINPFA